MKFFFKLFLGGFVFFSTLALIMIVAGSWWTHNEFVKPAKREEAMTIIVPNGSHIGRVATILQDEGIINRPIIFNYGSRIVGTADQIKAGEYEVDPHMSMRQILDLLVSGKTVQRNITIREGLTSFEIVNLLREHKGLVQDEVEIPPEGSLLAETYSYSKGEPVSKILERMQEAMIEKLDGFWETRAPLLPLKTKDEALVLASIIEKETAKSEERKTIAGVFVNRLHKGMLLQTDPTVIYALTEGKPKNEGHGPLGRRLLRKDLQFDSPYNTYIYAGLPPGPICNPGPAAIEAALNPEKHKYIYFVADGTGGHAFSKTLAEHNKNASAWRELRNSQ